MKFSLQNPVPLCRLHHQSFFEPFLSGIRVMVVRNNFGEILIYREDLITEERMTIQNKAYHEILFLVHQLNIGNKGANYILDCIVSDNIYTVIDIVEVVTYIYKKETPVYSERISVLNEAFSLCDRLENVKMIKFNIETNYSIIDVMLATDRLKEEGYKGLVIKDSNSPYRYKDCADWQSVVPFKYMQARVIDVESGSVKGSKTDRLSYLHIKYVIGDGSTNEYRCKVKDGFTEAQRYEIIKDHRDEDVVGRLVNINYPSIESNGKLRFPVFTSFAQREKTTLF